MTRPVTERMDEAHEHVVKARRVPKAYYLGPADLGEFCLTEPPTIDTLFNGKPSREIGYRGLPVREATAAFNNTPKSKLYCTVGTGFQVRPE